MRHERLDAPRFPFGATPYNSGAGAERFEAEQLRGNMNLRTSERFPPHGAGSPPHWPDGGDPSFTNRFQDSYSAGHHAVHPHDVPEHDMYEAPYHFEGHLHRFAEHDGWRGPTDDYPALRQAAGSYVAPLYAGPLGYGYTPRAGFGSGRAYGGSSWEQPYSGQNYSQNRAQFGADYANRHAMPDQPQRKRGTPPKGYTRSDQRIHEDVCERLMDDGLDLGGVEVSVKDGIVTFTGEVSQRSDKHRIEQLSAELAGVRDVDIQLRLRKQPGDSRAAEDHVPGDAGIGRAAVLGAGGQTPPATPKPD